MARRSGDPEDFDAGELRGPPVVALPLDDLRKALAQDARRGFVRSVVAGVIAGAVVAALVGLVLIKPAVTHAVSADIGRAAVANCRNAKIAANAEADFLRNTATSSSQLARQDVLSAQLDHGLSVQIRRLRGVPPAIARDYARQGNVYRRLAGDRAAIARADTRLLDDVKAATGVRCDRVLADTS